MNVQRTLRYLHRVVSAPPHITWQKAQRHLRRRAGNAWMRRKARYFNTQMTDGEFFRALTPGISTPGAFLAHLATRPAPQFFLHPQNRASVIAALRTSCPDAEARTIADAEQVCAHRFDLLGSGPVDLGEKIDWHVDFKSGHRWDPRQFYADVRSAPYPGGYDLKTPWELSRCQHFAWLGQAYWYTGDEKYTNEFVAQTVDWVTENPPLLGVNWACAMDVAIRAVNWLWAYAFFQHSPALTDAFRLCFFKSLLAHGRHIWDNLEWSETLTSNHYLSDIVGLVYLGLMAPEFQEAQAWRSFALQELEKEMFKQVYADGGDFEASLSYHRLATELFLSPTLLAQQNGHQFSVPYLKRLEQMLALIMDATAPDGSTPLIGDNDNGRLHRLQVWAEPDREWVDYRYLLAIGAVCFGRADFARAAGEQWEEATWFFGAKAVELRAQAIAAAAATASVYAARSQAYPDTGLYIMRHANLYMAIDAGSSGQKGNGGHSHNDLLSLVLFAHGQHWLIDPGAYVYTADYAARNLFRSTAYHNTVQVDGAEINPYDPARLFSMDRDAQPRVEIWVVDDDYDYFAASHPGYTRLVEPVVHQRQVFFDKREQLWIVQDRLSGAGSHRLEWHWRFAAEVSLCLENKYLSARNKAGQALHLWLLAGNAAQLTVEEGWVSPGYGRRTRAQVLHIVEESAALPAAQTFAFAPTDVHSIVDPQAVRRAYQRFLSKTGSNEE